MKKSKPFEPYQKAIPAANTPATSSPCHRLERTCRTCSKPFSISSSEQEWLKAHALEPFTHCKECRAIRKAERIREENAAREEKPKSALAEAAQHIEAAGKAVLAASKTSNRFQRYLQGANASPVEPATGVMDDTL